MRRILAGSVVAASSAMFLGWMFHATPLVDFGYRTAPLDQQEKALAALEALPETGTYVLPSGDDPGIEALARQGTAIIHVNREGVEKLIDPQVFALGFAHLFITCLLLALTIAAMRRQLPDFASRVLPVTMISLISAVWMRLGEPIWFSIDWDNAIYLAGTDFLTLLVAGLIVAIFVAPYRRRHET